MVLITPSFFLGGGSSKSNLTEAEMYQTALEKVGVPEKQIILENKSKNTFQNAEFTKPILEQHHINSIILITSGTHMRRALQYFQHFKINTVPAPADFPYPYISWQPVAYNIALMELAMHEWYGIARLNIYNFFGLNKSKK